MLSVTWSQKIVSMKTSYFHNLLLDGRFYPLCLFQSAICTSIFSWYFPLLINHTLDDILLGCNYFSVIGQLAFLRFWCDILFIFISLMYLNFRLAYCNACKGTGDRGMLKSLMNSYRFLGLIFRDDILLGCNYFSVIGQLAFLRFWCDILFIFISLMYVNFRHSYCKCLWRNRWQGHVKVCNEFL